MDAFSFLRGGALEDSWLVQLEVLILKLNVGIS